MAVKDGSGHHHTRQSSNHSMNGIMSGGFDETMFTQYPSFQYTDYTAIESSSVNDDSQHALYTQQGQQMNASSTHFDVNGAFPQNSYYPSHHRSYSSSSSSHLGINNNQSNGGSGSSRSPAGVGLSLQGQGDSSSTLGLAAQSQTGGGYAPYVFAGEGFSGAGGQSSFKADQNGQGMFSAGFGVDDQFQTASYLGLEGFNQPLIGMGGDQTLLSTRSLGTVPPFTPSNTLGSTLVGNGAGFWSPQQNHILANGIGDDSQSNYTSTPIMPTGAFGSYDFQQPPASYPAAPPTPSSSRSRAPPLPQTYSNLSPSATHLPSHPAQAQPSQTLPTTYPGDAAASDPMNYPFLPIHHVDTGPPPADLFPIAGTTIDPPAAFMIQGYLQSPNRYALGERKLVVHTPRVGQKSYGTEKRFLCPPPIANLIGRTWWRRTATGGHAPPSVNISISGENSGQDITPSWTTTFNRAFEDKTERVFPPGETPFIGKALGKSLHISDSMEKKQKTVNAVVTIHAAAAGNAEGGGDKPLVGKFESKPISIVSKPTKKRQTNRSNDLCLQHGTTISLYNRIRSQTSSTKYLAVSTEIPGLFGSDGKAIPTPAAMPQTIPEFIADPYSWDPFAIWLVDPAKHDAPSPPSSGKEGLEGFPPPTDAIDVPTGTPIPNVCYNNTVRLQCTVSGLLSPILVIRRVESATTVYGGDGTRKDGDLSKCPPGELPGEAVSQLHKVAFELYAPPYVPDLPVYGNDFKFSGQWLTAERERIEYRMGKTARVLLAKSSPSSPYPPGARLSNSVPSSPSMNIGGLMPLTRRSSGVNGDSVSSSPTPLSPVYGSAPNQDYFQQSMHAQQSPVHARHSAHVHAGGSHSGSSTPYGHHSNAGSSAEQLLETNGPGPIRRRRGSSSASTSLLGLSGISTPPKGTMSPPPLPKGSRNPSRDRAEVGDGSIWSVELSETATWTIVGAETKTYTFWVLPGFDYQTPITPLPSVTRCLPPGQAAEVNEKLHQVVHTTLTTLPQATFYGHDFTKDATGNPKYTVWWGPNPAQENEFRCEQVMTASIPRRPAPGTPPGDVKHPVSLVRADGVVVVPTSLVWKDRVT